jgi:hypothetical protein
MAAMGEMQRELADFARKVREKIDLVNTSKGKEAQKLQSELDLFIGQKMSELMSQGISVAEIQKALQAATDMVPQTYAPDDDGTEGISESQVYEVQYFLPMEERTIADFASGKIGRKEMMELLIDSTDITYLEMAFGLELILTDYGKDMSLDIACGEIVAGSDGVAFIPEDIDIEESFQLYSVSEPMVFKTFSEVKFISSKLDRITEELFIKGADIKKLIKAGWLADRDPASIKAVVKDSDYYIGELWEEFLQLHEVYRTAAEEKKGMTIFAGFMGENVG